MNWRGTPLVDLNTIVSLIGSTHSGAGPACPRGARSRALSRRVTVTDAQMATIELTRHRFHGDWNYTIRPATAMTALTQVVSTTLLDHPIYSRV
jgi:Rhodopirellula transposase DDE domain